MPSPRFPVDKPAFPRASLVAFALLFACGPKHGAGRDGVGAERAGGSGNTAGRAGTGGGGGTVGGGSSASGGSSGASTPGDQDAASPAGAGGSDAGGAGVGVDGRPPVTPVDAAVDRPLVMDVASRPDVP
ncbi:MAG TPA: hypothetical protein VGG33_05950, partial [Polyangia bacterium]